MELFFIPFACSLASHIVCREAALPVVLTRVRLGSKQMQGGGSLFDINPKGQVPTLRLDNGSVLTENVAVLQYLADMNPAAGLGAPAGADARYRLMEWLSFIGTEIHKRVLFTIFNQDDDAAARERARAEAPRKLAHVHQALAGREYLLGDPFTVADAYLLWALLLMPQAGVDRAATSMLRAYVDRCQARPGAAAAIEAERKLLKA
jgi:glutathione S-transferase